MIPVLKCKCLLIEDCCLASVFLKERLGIDAKPPDYFCPCGQIQPVSWTPWQRWDSQPMDMASAMNTASSTRRSGMDGRYADCLLLCCPLSFQGLFLCVLASVQCTFPTAPEWFPWYPADGSGHCLLPFCISHMSWKPVGIIHLQVCDTWHRAWLSLAGSWPIS